MSTPEIKKTSPYTIAFYWLLAGVPLAWGVSQTLTKVAAMFQ